MFIHGLGQTIHADREREIRERLRRRALLEEVHRQDGAAAARVVEQPRVVRVGNGTPAPERSA